LPGSVRHADLALACRRNPASTFIRLAMIRIMLTGLTRSGQIPTFLRGS
jgi:hypothetical protein